MLYNVPTPTATSPHAHAHSVRRAQQLLGYIEPSRRAIRNAAGLIYYIHFAPDVCLNISLEQRHSTVDRPVSNILASKHSPQEKNAHKKKGV